MKERKKKQSTKSKGQIDKIKRQNRSRHKLDLK